MSKERLFLPLLIMLLTVSCAGGALPETNATDAQTNAQQRDSDTVLTVTALKGGAADTFVLMSEDHTAIIDTGLDKNGDNLVDFLKEQGVDTVDELIITHFDKDHVGGADHVIDNFNIGKVYTTYQSKDSDDIAQLMTSMDEKGLIQNVVSDEIFWEADGVSYTIYPPQSKNYQDKESNNSSLVIRVACGGGSMLFAGDAQEERIDELLKTPNLKSTVLKVPHHGRLEANTGDLIDYVSPDYAIITSSTSELEDSEVLAALITKGVKTYLTRNGNITISFTLDGITITQK